MHQKLLTYLLKLIVTANATKTSHSWSSIGDFRPPVSILGVGGVVALSLECPTCDQEVVGSTLGRSRGIKTLGKFLIPVCLCSPSSISWYRPKGGDALRLGSKGRYSSYVGGR